MFVTGAKITSYSVVFPNYAAAKAQAEIIASVADDGETFEIREDPKGTGKCRIEMMFNGKSEGFF